MFFRILTIAALALLFLTIQIGLGYVLGLALRATGAVDPLAILAGDYVTAILPMMAVAMLATVAAFCVVLAVVDYGPGLAKRFMQVADAMFVIGNPSMWPLFRLWREERHEAEHFRNLRKRPDFVRFGGPAERDRLHRSSLRPQV